MPNSIAIFGAGPGLGQAVARRYAHEGYAVALIARRQEPLDELAGALAQEGATAHPIAADLSDNTAIPGLVEQIRAAVGDPDVIYYSAPIRGYVPATELTSENLRELMPISVYALVDLVHAFLPQMLERGKGTILTATGPTPLLPLPQLSAAAGLATQRNYLQALQAAVTQQGIFVGRLYIGATIKHSAFHAQQEAARAAGQPVIDLPLVDPEHLADLLFDMQAQGQQHEVVYHPTCSANDPAHQSRSGCCAPASVHRQASSAPPTDPRIARQARPPAASLCRASSRRPLRRPIRALRICHGHHRGTRARGEAGARRSRERVVAVPRARSGVALCVSFMRHDGRKARRPRRSIRRECRRTRPGRPMRWSRRGFREAARGASR